MHTNQMIRKVSVTLPSPQEKGSAVSAPRFWIVLGSAFFIVVLTVSAIPEADIRWLHFFQAWMYVATIALSLRRSHWGYFVGIACAGLWAYTNLFVTTFLTNGLHYLKEWARTGHLQRPDQLIAVPAWLSNALIVVACLWAYCRLGKKSAGDVAKFTLTFALTTGFFALDMYLFQPRYLALFARLLHPHWPALY